MVGPPIFAWMLSYWGWRGCFLISGGLGFLWMISWLISYRRPAEHAGVNAAELALITADGESTVERPVGWLEALKHREAWGFAALGTPSGEVQWELPRLCPAVPETHGQRKQTV